jgi:hypothetical protein
MYSNQSAARLNKNSKYCKYSPQKKSPFLYQNRPQINRFPSKSTVFLSKLSQKSRFSRQNRPFLYQKTAHRVHFHPWPRVVFRRFGVREWGKKIVHFVDSENLIYLNFLLINLKLLFGVVLFYRKSPKIESKSAENMVFYIYINNRRYMFDLGFNGDFQDPHAGKVRILAIDATAVGGVF